MPDVETPIKPGAHIVIGGVHFTVAESYDDILRVIASSPTIAIKDDDCTISTIQLTVIHPNNQTARMAVTVSAISAVVDVTPLDFPDDA